MNAWLRHLEGFQLAVVVVGCALFAAAVAVPRPVEPREIPLPEVDRAEERQGERERAALVVKARETPLPYRVRAVGEAIRRFGLAESGTDRARSGELSRDIVEQVRTVRAEVGDAPLLALRAVQTDLFVRAVTTWSKNGALAAEVAELGGGFILHARRNGWASPNGGLAIETDGLGTLFAMRWNLVTGLATVRPFAPTLNELRLYFRTLMAHPEVRGQDDLGDPQVLAGYVTGLCKHDPDYPEFLARGILSLRLGDSEAAVVQLSEHLRRNPWGPWWLRARNYLIAARERLPPDEP